MLSFYYPENPLFGKPIWEGKSSAVYFRSSKPLPRNCLRTREFGDTGVIFAAYQALGSINVPLVFCLHSFRKDDRDRNGLYDFDVLDLIEKVADEMDAQSAAAVLEYFRRYWYSYDRKKIDICSFQGFISQLVRSVSKSSDTAAEFRKNHPHLLVADRIHRRNLTLVNRRSQALSWKRREAPEFRLVQSSFSELGYERLEEACEQAGGFVLTRKADALQQRYIAILEKTADCLFPGFFGLSKLPACAIVIDENAVWLGMASCHARRDGKRNPFGHKWRFSMNDIAVKGSLLKKGSFAMAFSTYLHELCHVFGGDSSSNFSRALSDILEIVMRYSKVLETSETAWDAIETDQVK